MLKRNPCLKHWRMLLKIWKKYWQITAHMYFNFWYCNPISKANQGHKLKFSCPKWTFCHMLEHSKLYSSPFSPAQHNCWERGESQHRGAPNFQDQVLSPQTRFLGGPQLLSLRPVRYWWPLDCPPNKMTNARSFKMCPLKKWLTRCPPKKITEN